MNGDSERATDAGGVAPFHVHPGHLFEGFELVQMRGRASGAARTVLLRGGARHRPGPVHPLPGCHGAGGECARCAGTGRVVDHAALQWTAPDRHG